MTYGELEIDVMALQQLGETDPVDTGDARVAACLLTCNVVATHCNVLDTGVGRAWCEFEVDVIALQQLRETAPVDVVGAQLGACLLTDCKIIATRCKILATV